MEQSIKEKLLEIADNFRSEAAYLEKVVYTTRELTDEEVADYIAINNAINGQAKAISKEQLSEAIDKSSKGISEDLDGGLYTIFDKGKIIKNIFKD